MIPIKIAAFIIAAFAASATIAADNGTIEIYGKGVAAAKPEQVQIQVSVISLCYAEARAAADANAVLANKVVTLMQTYRQGAQDKVVATGGPTVRQDEYSFDNGATDRKILCQNQWRVTNTLILTTSDMNKIPDIQDALLDSIAGAQDVKPGVATQTYAQLSEPTFSLLPATVVRLRAEAQKKAFDDAKTQYDGFAAMCDFKNPRLVSITPPSETTPVPRFAPQANESGSTSTPVLPDEMQIQAKWKFVWEYDPSSSCADMK